MSLSDAKKGLFFRLVSVVQLAVFLFSSVITPGVARAQSVYELPAPGTMVLPSNDFVPVILRAVKIHPDQPLVFDFIVDSGSAQVSREDVKTESEKLAKYFLASLTIPENDLWVNLSPYEGNRIIPDAFGQTEMGRDLLAEDYILKQLSASLVHPDKDLGKEFWSRVYARAQKELGTTAIPANTFNKVWIVPEKAVVYETNDTAIVGEAHLKVMLDQDYLAMSKNKDNASLGTDGMSDEEVSGANRISTDVVRDIVIPEIEKEVNTGKNFATLRQIYGALILATWYKESLKETLLAKVYENQNKVAGVDILDKAEKDRIYERYISAYKEGVFNLIREDVDPVSQETLPRKYFSGGAVLKLTTERHPLREATPAAKKAFGDFAMVTVAARAGQAMKQDPKIEEPLKQELLSSPAIPENIKTMLSSDTIRQPQGERLKFLADRNQRLLLSKMSKQTPRQVASVLEHLTLKDAYPGGLVKYFSNFVRALINKAKGITMFSDLTIVRQPQEGAGKDYIDYTKGGTKLQAAYRAGLKKVPGLALAKVAGGAGKRLGSERAKAALEVDQVTHKTFLQLDCETIQALQKESDRENKIKNTQISLFIMVSDETVQDTLKLLNDNNSFQLKGHILLDLNRYHIVARDGKKMLFDKTTNQYQELPQIIVVKQESVPELVVGAPVRNPANGEMENDVQLDTDKNDGILTRIALADEMPNGGEVFDLLMANGTFDETTGIDGHVKALGEDTTALKALIMARYPAVDFNRVIAILNETHDRSRVAQAGHGHQDVHILMKQSGFADAHFATGGTSTIVMQDTNEALRRLELPAILLAGLEGDVTVNTTTIFRNPRERTGAYGVFRAPDGREVLLNIEYTVLPKVAESLGLTEANFQLGNINYIAFRQDAYVEFLKKTGGVTPEFAAPKVDKGRPGDIQLRGRGEGNFQDALREMPGRTVAILVPKHYGFLTTKNNVEETMTFIAQALQDGRTIDDILDMDLEHRGWSDSMDSDLNQKLLAQAGVKMPERTRGSLYKGVYRSQYYNVGTAEKPKPALYVEGISDPKNKPTGPLMREYGFEGIPYSEGITLKFSPRFATSDGDVIEGRSSEGVPPKVSGGEIMAGSVVALDGEGLILNNTTIDGTAILSVEDGARAVFNGTKIKNKGSEKVFLSLAESQDKGRFSETARMHGFYYKDREKTQVRVTKGEVVIGANVDLKGNVTIVNETAELLDTKDLVALLPQSPDGRIVLENKVITKTDKGITVSDAAMKMTTDQLLSPEFQESFQMKIAAGEAVQSLIKPDGQAYSQALVSEIESKGFRVRVGPTIQLTAAEVREIYAVHYGPYLATKDLPPDQQQKKWWPDLEALMTRPEGVSLLFVDGNNVDVPAMMTERKNAIRADVNGTFSSVDGIKPDNTANRLHASDSKESAKAEFEVIMRIVKARADQLRAAERQDAAQKEVGGIDLANAANGLKVERTGERIKVTVDPAMVERIRAEGVNGFAPVIINIMPIKAMFPALGLSDAAEEERLAGVAS